MDTLARYKSLCSIRDGVNEANKEQQTKLDDINLQIQDLQRQALVYAGFINQRKLDNDWVMLNKEIAALARVLSRKDGPLGA